jgi:heme-binding NEAT domain protein
MLDTLYRVTLFGAITNIATRTVSRSTDGSGRTAAVFIAVFDKHQAQSHQDIEVISGNLPAWLTD